MRWLLATAVALLAASDGLATTVIDGNSLAWTLTNATTSVPGAVPGGVYTDLMDSGVLDQGDFFYRYNDVNYRWVAYCNWTYSTSFEVSAELAAEARIGLEFDGIDTAAAVYVNGRLLGSTDNMFVRYFFDITDVVKDLEDKTVRIEVRLQSPVDFSQKAYDAQTADYEVPPECPDPAYRGECHANHIRKMQASFGWDWGPAFPNMGIWKPMRVVGFSTARIVDVFVTPWQQHQNSKWWLNLTVNFRAVGTQPVDGTVSVYADGALLSATAFSDLDPTKDDIAPFTTSFETDLDELWWPVGYGEQKLYNISVSYTASTTPDTDVRFSRIGLRHVELNQDFIDPDNTDLGRYYRVYVNKVLVFMRGSNWIPADVLPERVTQEYTRQLLQDALDAHHNSLRVWGGGIYETDAFYDITDELGILVWQDMMFACSMYPASDWFLSSVSQEVNSQMGRLNTHPSVLLYATNNENEAALRDDWYGTQSDFDQYKSDYVTLYVDTVREAIWASNDTREVVVSSPSNGIESEEEGYIAKQPYDPKYGDVHFYDYVKDAWDPETFPATRFASEYGYQSWPCFRTLSKVTTSEDWRSDSDMLDHRQHHPNGQAELEQQIKRHFFLPDPAGGTTNFKHYLYLTQVHQATAVRSESEAYRRLTYTVDTSSGEGYTSGALYWQLNDVWQGASWASIEYGGRWKMLHYFSKKFFHPTLVSPFWKDDKVSVSFVNDLEQEYSNISLTVSLWSYASLDSKYQMTIEGLSFDSYSAAEVAQIDLNEDLGLNDRCHDADFAPSDNCFVTFTASAMGELVAPETYLLLGEPKDSTLQPANVKVTRVAVGGDTTYTVTIATDEIALFVFLETDVAGVFSDNGFLMIKQTMELQFEAREPTDADFLLSNIEITSLADTFPANA